LDAVQLVELIESEAKKLSAHSSEIWVSAESTAELNTPGAPEVDAALHDLRKEFQSLGTPDFYTIRRLIKLNKARIGANELEKRCDDARFASAWRWRGVIEAAQLKDQEAGRPIELDMTGSEALNKLGDA
jgi:hypothetical protein